MVSSVDTDETLVTNRLIWSYAVCKCICIDLQGWKDYVVREKSDFPRRKLIWVNIIPAIRSCETNDHSESLIYWYWTICSKSLFMIWCSTFNPKQLKETIQTAVSFSVLWLFFNHFRSSVMGFNLRIVDIKCQEERRQIDSIKWDLIVNDQSSVTLDETQSINFKMWQRITSRISI